MIPDMPRNYSDNAIISGNPSVTSWTKDTILKRFMAKIDATDALIDQIVYKLYGLTDEEIKIVEGNG
jgi:hypothetical protein